MHDPDCVAFLQWALPRLGFRWPGFRKVRRQVCRRVAKRIAMLGLADIEAYRDHLRSNEAEWRELEGLCRITISRFYRDRAIFDCIGAQVLPELARCAIGRPVRAWSAGCASGEEPYTLSILWRLGGADDGRPRLDILATDADPHMLERARTGCYGRGSLRDVPAHWLGAAFEPSGDRLCVRTAFREAVAFEAHDLRDPPPPGPFDLVLCRNLAFTYFDEALQRATLGRIAGILAPGGYLVVGRRESLPPGTGFEAAFGCPEILAAPVRP